MEAAVIFAARERVSRRSEERRRRGIMSAEARVAKHGREALVAHMRSIAVSGGKARYAMLSPEERRERAAAGGRASWAKLTPEQRAQKRAMIARGARNSLTHEQRVANGKRGMAIRWAKK